MKSRFAQSFFGLLLVAAGLSSALPTEAQTNGLLREAYLNISGSTVANLLNAPNYPANPDAVTVLTNSFEAPINWADNYGQRVRGFLIPPQTGNYVFWIASDDQSVLSLSSDENPANKRDIATVVSYTGSRQWDKEDGQMSIPIHLEAGRYYFLEALMKEGGGADNLAVRWQLPDSSIEEPIPASRFVLPTTPLHPPQLTAQPTNVTVAEAGTAIFGVEVSNLDILRYQWQRNGAPIPGATQPAYTNLNVGVADQGARYSCSITNSLGGTNSNDAVLTVVPDTTPPVLVSVVNTGNKSLLLTFSEPVYLLGSSNDFVLNNGATVLAVAGGPTPSTVVLTTSPLALRSVYTLTVNGVVDRSAASNPILPNTQRSFISAELSPVDIGRPAQPGSILPVANGFQLTAGGAGIGGTADQFQFSYQERVGNFDQLVCVRSLSLSDSWAKVGLMARESLEANSRFAATLATPNVSGCFFESRSATGVVSVVSGSWPVNYPETWLRLKREGSLITGFASLDGTNWAVLGSVQLSLTNKIYFGVALTSHNPNQTAVAVVQEMGNVVGTPQVAVLPAEFEPLGPSNRRTGLVLSEIMYHPAPRADGKATEFIELFNADAVAVDMSGYQVDGSVRYAFPNGTLLPAGAFLVLARAPADVNSVYGLTNAVGPYAGNLPNGAGTLQLKNNLGAILLEVAYASASPWPVAADGAGHSLVLARPSFGEGNPAAWAASARVGGSPGRAETYRADPLRAVVINEFLANSEAPDLDFIELYNHSNLTLDLSGCSLSDDPNVDKFTLPSGTIVRGRGLVVFDQNQLGFALSSAGEAIYFKNPDRSEVLDAVRFGPTATGVSLGRYPDGAPTFHELLAKTPGTPNQGLLLRDVVLNEIMFHPISGNDNLQYVELYNRGATNVALEGWQLAGGIRFTFPTNASIPARGYVVVAKSAAQLRTAYTNLGAANLWGDFQGKLAKRGERIALTRPDVVWTTNLLGTAVAKPVAIVVDEVTYGVDGRWGKWADGGGSSLELIDAHSDNRLAANWADSDESAKSPWTTIEKTGILDNGYDGYGIDRLEIIMLGEGECLVDNVEVSAAGGPNLILNSTFEGGTNGYTFRGTHKHSSLENRGGYQSARCLRVRATARGDTGPNQISTPLTTPLEPGAMVTIRAQVRWLKGWPEILFRLHGNYLEAAGVMTLPPNLGTPGAQNSRAVNNAGPAIFAVAHSPVLPADNEPVLVTARVHDPDGLASVTLNYRFDPAVTVLSLPMRDDGTGGDAVAGDGIYSATLPGAPAGTLVAFSIVAKDRGLPAVSSAFPSDAPTRECLVRYGESVPAGSFGTYLVWFTQATLDEWIHREQGSNEPLDATFAYGSYRSIYNFGILYSGSPFHWRGYDSPVGRNCTYVLNFNRDDPLLGAGDFVLNMPSNLGSDPALQREQVTHWIGSQLGVPYTHRRFVHVTVNGVPRGNIYEDSQQPNADFLNEWFPQDANGDLHKIDDWFEFTPYFGFHNVDATLELFLTTGGEKKQARYRWNWRKRAVHGSANDYTNLFALVDALNATAPEEFTRRVAGLVDLEEWMRTTATRHLVGDWDSYGYRRGKNMYAYKPQNGKWNLLNWDISFDLGLGDGPTHSLFDVTHFDGSIDPISDRMFQHPPFRRVYLRALQDAMNGPLLNGNIDPIMDAKYAALKANGISVSSPDSIKGWIRGRRDYVQRLLSTNTASFAITSNDGQPLTTNRNLIRLTGTAPVEVAALRVNGTAYPVTWTTVTNWTLPVAVGGGSNWVTVQGYDHSGNALSNATASLAVVFNGPKENPRDHLVLNEIMYQPEAAGAEYVELFNSSVSQAFDLSGLRLDGVDFTFADGTFIPAQGFVLVVQDPATFEAVYGPGLPVVGTYNGKLQNGGETLTLLKPGATAADDLVINRVTYDQNPPWPGAAAGTGASLQLIDPAQDNNRVGNWDAVGTNGLAKPRWQYVSVTGRASSSRLTLSLSAAGEVYLDDLSLVAGIIPRVGSNLVANGDFESPLAGSWQMASNYAATTISSQAAHAGSGALRLATAAGLTNLAGAVSQDLTPALIQDQFYTLSYWYLPGTAGGQLTVKLDGDGLVSTQRATPAAIARRTPGQPNSVRALLAPLPALWINEVQPTNTGLARTTAGEAGAWIELYNAGGTVLNLNGHYVANSYSNLTAWPFPGNAVLQPGEYRLIWADGHVEQTTPNEWHTSFTLEPLSGVVALSRLDFGQPTVIDYLAYAGLGPGLSFGSYPDGNPWQRQTFVTPTPAAPNIAPANVVRINEWMASNTSTLIDPATGKFEDWFELYNPGPLAVDLSHYSLSDVVTNPAKTVLPKGTLIAAGGFLLVWADNRPQANAPGQVLHVGFRLNKDGDAIALFNPAGGLVDAVTFGPQTHDVSQGRWPDGQAGPFYFIPAPTPGAPNANPSGSTNPLRFTGISVASGTVTITFQTEPGKQYQAQYKDTLIDPSWSNLGDAQTATSTKTAATDSTLGAHPQRYYRIVLLSAP